MIRQVFLVAVLALALGGLSACDSAEERAERHYQNGMELLEAGDVDRALVEFRNVFQLNGQHREARKAYAGAERARGNLQEAFGHYLRLVEQYPDSLVGQRALAEMALETGNWEAFLRHGTAAVELAPDDLEVRGLEVVIAYREAVLDRDAEARTAAVVTARALLVERPDLLTARRIVIEDLADARDWTGALELTDAGLADAPDNRELHDIRLGLLNQIGAAAEIEAQLHAMVERFPEDANVPLALVRWYLSQGEVETAEAYLREQITAESQDMEDLLTLVRFLMDVRGPEAARDELDAIIVVDPPDVARFRALRAGITFELGNREAAITEMQTLIAELEPSDDRRNFQAALARMLMTTGEEAAARALVDTVLEEDSTQVEALKLRASWLIGDDRTQEAISALRSALGQSPRDPQIMTLLARAHERAGNRDLMAEMLSQAVQVSNRAPGESLRYALYLLSEERYRSAEDILIEALRLAPDSVLLLGALGEAYLGMSDWLRLQSVISALRSVDDPAATSRAEDLTARQLAAQEREQELTDFLQGIADRGGAPGAVAALLRLRLAAGDIDGALEYAEGLLEENPEDPTLRFIHGGVLAVGGRFEAAETVFRDILAEHPRSEQVWMALYNLLAGQGETEAARAVLDEALTVLPENQRLNWLLAGLREREGDIEGAIDIYEALYARDSEALVIANNLASLLSVHRDDAESLERAHRIAQRLRGLQVPPFQDTYGWIAFRRGDMNSALSHLEPAAEGLPDDPMVQYHLAMTYAALERNEAALERFRRVMELAGERSLPTAYREKVEDEIARLGAVTAAESDGEEVAN